MPTPASRPRARLATADDGAACAAIYAPYVTGTSVSFELVPPDAAEMGARIARTIERTPWVVVETDGAVRAYAYGTRHRDRAAYDRTVETTVYVDGRFTRLGLGRTAMRALLAILRLQGAHLAVAGVTLPNPGSVGLHEALGFEAIGVFPAIGHKSGRWHDVAWYGLELGPRGDDPAPLIPLPRLEGSPALAAALAEPPARRSSPGAGATVTMPDDLAGVTVREAQEGDGPARRAFFVELTAEPDLLTTLSHEEALAFTDESQRQLLREHLARPNTLWLVALDGGRLVGELTLIGGRHAGNAHTVVLGISVARDWRGRGVGRALTIRAIEWARRVGSVRRIELDVFSTNAPAIRLYEQLGFVTEGRRRSAYLKNGVEIDGLVMALLL